MTGRRVKNSKKVSLIMKSGFYLYAVICLVSIVWLKAAVVNLEYDMGALGNLKTDLVRERNMAVAQRANFYSPEKIENVAVKRLGMTLPERENIYFVKRTPVAVSFRASMK